jgi:sensor histidine kinase YesM
MGVQPIVENAVRHGISNHRAGGTIEIQAMKVYDALHIIVRDDGPGIASQSSCAGHGMGLTNLRARLQQLYADLAEVRIENADARGTVVTIVLPFRRHVAADEGLAMMGESIG